MERKSLTDFGDSAFFSLPPHQEAGATADFSGFFVLCEKTLLEPVILGGGAGFLLSHGVSASAVLEKNCCVPVDMRLKVLG